MSSEPRLNVLLIRILQLKLTDVIFYILLHPVLLSAAAEQNKMGLLWCQSLNDIEILFKRSSNIKLILNEEINKASDMVSGDVNLKITSKDVFHF